MRDIERGTGDYEIEDGPAGCGRVGIGQEERASESGGGMGEAVSEGRGKHQRVEARGGWLGWGCRSVGWEGHRNYILVGRGHRRWVQKDGLGGAWEEEAEV